jgi:phage terminase large subunit
VWRLVNVPHDGAHGDKAFATLYESAIREAGLDVLVVPNQGAGAAFLPWTPVL